MKKKYLTGFTLLELLVVIGIIAILVTLATVAYSTAQKSTRDSRRRGDMKAVQNAIEQYYSLNSFKYPATVDCSNVANATYIQSGALPVDPGSNSYTYQCSQTAYCVCAHLERTGTGNATAPAGSTTCSYATGDYYCVSNLQ